MWSKLAEMIYIPFALLRLFRFGRQSKDRHSTWLYLVIQAFGFTMIIIWALISSVFLSGLASPTPRTYDTHNYYVLSHIPSRASLADVLQALGVELVEQAGELQHHWLVKQRKPHQSHQSRSNIDPVLSAFDALKAHALTSRSEDSHHLARRIVASVDYLSLQTLRRRVKRAPPAISPPKESPSRNVAARLGIQDPLFSHQWHLVNDDFPQHMMNVTAVWDMGFKGKGIISSLVDDGLDYESEDLSANFVCPSLIQTLGLAY